MAEQKRRLGLQDLAAAYGLKAPVVAPVTTDTDNFYSLPLLDRIRTCDEVSGAPSLRQERRERKVATIGDILKTGRREREKLGFQVIVAGTMDSGGKIVAEDPSLQSVNVYVLYPSNFEGRPRMKDCSDSLLFEQEGISLDSTLRLADEIRPESVADHQDRLRMNLKVLDTLISRQKGHSLSRRYGLDYAPVQRQVTSRNTTQEMERLNRLKTIAVHEFIIASLEVETENPHLQPLFTFAEEGNGTHLTLTMWSPSDKNVLQRLLDPTKPMLLEDDNFHYSTNISLVQLQENHRKVEQNMGNSLPHDLAGRRTLDLLLHGDLRERRREKSTETRRSVPREITPDLGDFLKLPVAEQLAKALADAKAAGPDKMAKERVHHERNAAVKNTLETPLDERRRAGLDVVVIAPLDRNGTLLIDDPELAEYSVNVLFNTGRGRKFLNTRRSSLAELGGRSHAMQSDDLAAIDALILQEPTLLKETTLDTYLRRLHEMKLLGFEMARLSKERKVIPDRDLPAQQAISQRISELGGKRTISALSAWEMAEVIQTEHPAMNLVSATVQTQREITVIAVQYKDITVVNNLWWLQNPQGERRLEQSNFTFNTWFQQTKLRKMVDAAAFDETEANGAALILSEKLQEIGIKV